MLDTRVVKKFEDASGTPSCKREFDSANGTRFWDDLVVLVLQVQPNAFQIPSGGRLFVSFFFFLALSSRQHFFFSEVGTNAIFSSKKFGSVTL